MPSPRPSDNGEMERSSERPLLPALGRNNNNGGAGEIVVATDSNKRLQNDGMSAAPAPKRRAARACTSCRSRKVRCDVTSQGSQSMPCTNCRLDSVECRLTQSSRGRPRLVPGARETRETRSSTQGQQTQAQVQEPHESQDEEMQDMQETDDVAQPPLPPQQQQQFQAPQQQYQQQYQPHRMRRMSNVVTSSTSPRPDHNHNRHGLNHNHNHHNNHNHLRHHNQSQNHVATRRHSAAAADLYASTVSPSPTRMRPLLHSQPQRQGTESDTNFFVSPRSLPSSACSPASIAATASATEDGNGNGVVGHAPANATNIDTHIPAHFKPLPPHLQPVDIEYLARKGALTLPPEEVQREIILKHIQYVHPFMPVLNLPDFLTGLVRREPGSCSLLLFQAVMFTSANFIDMDYHKHMAPDQSQPPDHAAIRKTFFSRARLLYDQDCEQDKFTLLQALLLMTVWYQRPGDEKETWYWTGVMLSLAQTLGLHRNPEHLQDVPLEMRLLRKRIWWSCVVQDRLLAIGLKRPSRIRKGDYDVPPLTFADFNIETLPSELLRYLGPLPLSDDTPSKTSIVMSFIALSQLCELIGDILETQYSRLLSNTTTGNNAATRPISLDHLAVMVVPRNATDVLAEMQQCDAALDAWSAALDKGSRFHAGRHEKDSSHRVLWLHQALLHMVYLTTVVMLHRPRVFQADSIKSGSGDGGSGGDSGGDGEVAGGPARAAQNQNGDHRDNRDPADPEDHDSLNALNLEIDNTRDNLESMAADIADPAYVASIRRSKDKITRAAAGITEVIYDLYHDSQLRFVSPAAISALVSATIIHLFDLRSAAPDARYSSIGRFYQCWQALHQLRGLYASADQSIAFLEFYISKTQVNIPMLTLSPSAASMSMSTSWSSRSALSAPVGPAGSSTAYAARSTVSAVSAISPGSGSGSSSSATPDNSASHHALSVMTSLHSEVQPPHRSSQPLTRNANGRPGSISRRLPSVSNLVASPGPRVSDMSSMPAMSGMSTMPLSAPAPPMGPLLYTRDEFAPASASAIASAPRSPALRDRLFAAVDGSMTPAMEATGPHMHHHHHLQNDDWSGMSAVDSMLQSFIDFNADSAFFTATGGVEHDGMVSSPMAAHLR